MADLITRVPMSFTLPTKNLTAGAADRVHAGSLHTPLPKRRPKLTSMSSQSTSAPSAEMFWEAEGRTQAREMVTVTRSENLS